MNGSRLSKSNLMIGAAALVLVAGVVVVAGGYYPARGGHTAGTLAPMNRYQSNQVNGSDVVTGDTSVPNMMQTDSFQGVTAKTQTAAQAASQAASQSAALAS